MENIDQIVRHLYANKDGSLWGEYRVYGPNLVCESKTKSELTEEEKEWLEKFGSVIVYHF